MAKEIINKKGSTYKKYKSKNEKNLCSYNTEVNIPNIILTSNFANIVDLNQNVIWFFIKFYDFVIKNDKYFFDIKDKKIFCSKINSRSDYFDNIISVMIDYKVLVKIIDIEVIKDKDGNEKEKTIEVLTADYMQLKYLNYYRYQSQKHNFAYDYDIPKKYRVLPPEAYDKRTLNGRKSISALIDGLNNYE